MKAYVLALVALCSGCDQWARKAEEKRLAELFGAQVEAARLVAEADLKAVSCGEQNFGCCIWRCTGMTQEGVVVSVSCSKKMCALSTPATPATPGNSNGSSTLEDYATYKILTGGW